MNNYTKLTNYVKQIMALEQALSLLSWDNEVIMSEGGTEGRALTAGTLATLRQEMVVSDTFKELYDNAVDDGADDELEQDHLDRIGVFLKNYASVEPEIEAQISQARVRGQRAWKAARETQDFLKFSPELAALISLNRERAHQINSELPAYEVLVQQYEEDCKLEELDVMFGALEAPLYELLETYSSLPHPKLFDQVFPPAQQELVSRDLLDRIGFCFESGRLDKAVHPFCMGLHPKDVRLTNRYRPTGLMNSMYGALHEGGHGLYEQGIDERLATTLCHGGASLGVHESQSRLWENLVGRSQGFWKGYFKELQARFPHQMMGYSWQDAWLASNKIQVNDIRVEADEVTYNLHIALRYELERKMFAGELAVTDIPEAWNAKFHSLFGRNPKNIVTGCLQDVHWCESLFGYFPTYTIGNVVSASLWSMLKQDLPALDDQIEALDFNQLLQWLRSHIHVKGHRVSGKKLLEQLGLSLDPQDFIDYLNQKYQTLGSVER